MCEPNRVSHGMVQGIDMGLCEIYVGICGCLCVNQLWCHMVWFNVSMWVYVESMWVYVGVYV